MRASVGGLGGLARRAALLLALLLTGTGTFAANGIDDFRILYAESFAPAAPPAGTTLKPTDDPLLGGLGFDAYGRRFTALLERNARVMLDGAGTGAAYRGTIAGLPGSWIRLTRTGSDLHGLIWDTSDLYVIEPVAEARAFLVTAPAGAAGGHVIYRLSDTLVDLGPGYCSALDPDSPDPVATGLSTFKAITTELKSQLVLQRAPGAARSMSLSALGDDSFLQRFASAAEARDAVLVRLNNVDGIFSEQVGVELQIRDIELYEGTTDPFTQTTVANDLLAELGRIRNGSSALRADGLTHLFTGRNLDGNTVGIAYINALCSRSFGVGLTEIRGRGAVLESLIAAHEIGHNFGAGHDGVGECAATASDAFIMSPQSRIGNDTFSQCSVNVMSRSVATAGCIGALPPPDAEVSFSQPPATLTLEQSFSWSLTVTNGGGQQTPSATVTLTLPATFVVEDASTIGGSCSSGTGSIQCTLGAVDSGESRVVAMTLRPQASGFFTVTALADAANDVNAANDSATGALAVDAVVPATTPSNEVATGTTGGSGGGGGGAVDVLALLGLAFFGVNRQRLRTAG